MYDWLSQLGPPGRVLDIASARGSFSTRDLACSVIAVDEDLDAFATMPPAANERSFRIIGGAERLPVASARAADT